MKSEFAQLSDLAMAQGVSHSELISEIHQAIISEYRKQYPKAPVGIAVLVDETTGLVRIFSGEKDITPDKFSSEASRIARQIVLEKLSPSSFKQTVPGDNREIKVFASKNFRPAGIIGKIFFWGYNLYFCFFNLSIGFSFLLSKDPFSLFKELGLIKTVLLAGLFLLPVFSMAFALHKGLRRQTANLTQLFFLFEVPLALFLFICFLLAGQTSLFISLTLTVLLSIPFLLYLHLSQIELSTFTRKIIAPFSQLAAVFAGYYTLLFTFVVPLIVVGTAKSIFGNIFQPSYYYEYGQTIDKLADYPGKFLTFGLGLLIILLIITLVSIPYLLTFLLWRLSENNRLALQKVLGNKKMEKISLISWGIIFLLVSLSFFKFPDNRLMVLLKNFPKESDYQVQEKAASTLINQEERLKTLVTKKIKERGYYLFYKDDNSLSNIYREVFNSQLLGDIMQSGFIHLAYPLVYWESEEGQWALTENFQYLFGYPYYQEKTKSVVNEPKNVLLAYRQIKVTPENEGFLATITIEEEYDNQTYQQQEVVYEFNLPEEATISDLKLGANLEFPGVIAPKGAAQRTYERELRQSRDPALLEQTGPNQYRLRVFPIPAKNDLTTLKGQRQKVAFSYTVGWDNGYFPLPVYTRKANVFTDGSSIITLESNGRTLPLKGTETKIESTEIKQLNLCQSQSGLVVLQTETAQAKVVFHANNERLRMIACGKISDLLSDLTRYRTAIIYDTSVNNKQNNSLKDLKLLIEKNQTDWLDKAVVDLYKINSTVSQAQRLTSKNLKELLQPVYFSKVTDFSKLAGISEKYDLVILIANKDISFNQIGNFPFSSPTKVYWVGSEEIPPLNMEITSGIWQTGGGATTSIEDAFRAFLLKETVKQTYGEGVMTTNQYWSLQYDKLPGQLVDSVFSPSESLANLANKGLLMRFVDSQTREVVGDIAIMDQLNLAAKKAGIISPYSSLIALVNEQQKDRLETEIGQYNRYQDQTATENIALQPLPISRREWGGGVQPFGGIMDMGLSIPSFESSGSNLKMSGYGVGAGYSSLSGIFGGSLFILFSAVTFGVGFVFYLLRLVRKK